MASEPQHPHDELRRLLNDVRIELEWALRERPEWFGPRYPEFMAAWRELDHEVFPVAIGELGQVSVRDLADAGLTGAQLRLKMALVDDALDALEHARQEESGPPKGGIVGRIRRWLGRRAPVLHAFGGFIEIADVVLESLGKALPPAGAIAEFKDSVKSMLGAT